MQNLIKVGLFPLLILALGLFWDSVFISKNHDSTHSNSYPEHLTGTFTGGFGEDTCHSCHFDYPLNHQEGTLYVEGFPQNYESGQSYMIYIQVERPQLAKAGFQLSARFSDGRQAGMFGPQSDRTQFTESVSDSIQYLQHSAKGTDSNAWQLKWIAPSSPSQDTIFIHLSANAANGDASEFGDFILTKAIQIPAR